MCHGGCAFDGPSGPFQESDGRGLNSFFQIEKQSTGLRGLNERYCRHFLIISFPLLELRARLGSRRILAPAIEKGDWNDYQEIYYGK